MTNETSEPEAEASRLEREVYLEERRYLIQAEAEQSRSLDKALLTLAAGALGISVSFIKDVVPEFRPCTAWILYAGWTALVASLLCTLWSFLTSMKAMSRQREILDAMHIGTSEPDLLVNSAARWTSRLNYCAFVIFVAGAAALTLFVALNIHM